jgi:hypothetical protein
MEIYLVSNQLAKQRSEIISLRKSGYVPELWDAVTGEHHEANGWEVKGNRTWIPLKLDANGSVFIVMRKATMQTSAKANAAVSAKTILTLKPGWQVTFDPKMGGPKTAINFTTLTDWGTMSDPSIRYYSGTAVYEQAFDWKGAKTTQPVWLNLGTVNNLAEVYVNGVNCGVAWTAPYRVNISKALKPGLNQLKIEVTNTWANRLMGDHDLPKEKQITWTNAPYRLEEKALLPAGLMGPVLLEK